MADINLRTANNPESDVVQNLPRPIRIFDQICMKSGDMVMQSELVASWAKDQHLAFIGDSDAFSVCVTYLQKRGILEYGPFKIVVYDYERFCSAAADVSESRFQRAVPSQDTKHPVSLVRH